MTPLLTRPADNGVPRRTRGILVRLALLVLAVPVGAVWLTSVAVNPGNWGSVAMIGVLSLGLVGLFLLVMLVRGLVLAAREKRWADGTEAILYATRQGDRTAVGTRAAIGKGAGVVIAPGEPVDVLIRPNVLLVSEGVAFTLDWTLRCGGTATHLSTLHVPNDEQLATLRRELEALGATVQIDFTPLAFHHWTRDVA